jgi:thiol-disulfide isomerase/thioredoxin
MQILKYCVLLFCLTVLAGEVPDPEPAGIGVVLGAEGTNIIVKRMLPDSPAAAAPDLLHVGDRIMAVGQGNDPAIPVQSSHLAQTVAMIRGAKGTTVRLTIVPSGADDSEARVVSMTRGYVKALSGWGNGILLTNGTKAPDMAMVRLVDGKAEQLLDSGGKIIVLEFWATWCGPCQPKVADLQNDRAKYPDWKENVVLIAASVDETVDIVAKHMKAKGWDRTHNVWVGTDSKKSYHIDSIPTAYVIDPKGRIVAANPVDLPALVNQLIQLRLDRP